MRCVGSMCVCVSAIVVHGCMGVQPSLAGAHHSVCVCEVTLFHNSSGVLFVLSD